MIHTKEGFARRVEKCRDEIHTSIQEARLTIHRRDLNSFLDEAKTVEDLKPILRDLITLMRHA